MNPTDPTSSPQTGHKILIKPRVNPRKAEMLMQAGIKLQQRDDMMVRAKQISEAVEVNKDPFHFKRVDATGIKRPDSGSPVFGKQGLHNVSLAPMMADLKEAGYALTSASLFQKQGDGMYFLCLGYEAGPKAMELSPAAEDAINHILSQAYESVHVWENPNNTATVNVNHAIQEARGMLREVRFQNGKFSEKLTQSVTV